MPKRKLSLDGISATARSGCTPPPGPAARRSGRSSRPTWPRSRPAEIEKWAEDYILRLLDLCAELGVKIVPMFWGVAFGWELATGYPWGFWKGGDYDFIKEGQERFVKKTAKIRKHANDAGHLPRPRNPSRHGRDVRR